MNYCPLISEMNVNKKELDTLITVPSQTTNGEVIEPVETHDTVFGPITEDGPNYRNVSFIT